MTTPKNPVIKLDVVVVVPIILARSSVLFVIAAGKDQNGISTAVNAILPVTINNTAAITHITV